MKKIILIVAGAFLLSACSQNNQSNSGHRIVEMSKIKGVMGMTKEQVLAELGKPESASDKYFSYYMINPITGKESMCMVWFGLKQPYGQPVTSGTKVDNISC